MTKDIGKPTQAEKQAFWAEQIPDFKANYICQSQLEALEFNNKTGNFDALTKDETGFELEDILESYHSVNTGWSMWLKAKAHEAKNLEGCVVVPESEYNEIAQYKDLYKRAIVNARKRKNQINWAHVAGLGVGSGRAVELCKELKIDPHATDMNAMLEAARGGNENS